MIEWAENRNEYTADVGGVLDLIIRYDESCDAYMWEIVAVGNPHSENVANGSSTLLRFAKEQIVEKSREILLEALRKII